MRRRPFGTTGIETSAVGYGGAALSLPEGPPEDEARQLLRWVLQAGVAFLDTADTYGPRPEESHHNERLIREAIAIGRESRLPILVATKGGARRTPSGGWEIAGAPDHLYRAICGSYRALGGDSPIPLWQLHWPDPRFSLAEMLAPARRAVDEQLVQFLGVCNVSLAQLKQARDVVPLVSVQNQFNLWRREAETDGILEYCEQHGLVFLPWRPLGGLGLAQRLGQIGPLATLASQRGVSPQRLTIAWLLAKSPCVLPIFGSARTDHIRDCLAAVDERLDAADVRRLDAISSADLPRRDRPAAWEDRPPLAKLDSGIA